MKILVKASLLERIRRKELYIVFVIGLLMIILTCTGNNSISINGESLVGFENKLMIFQTLINFFSCLLAVVLSINTIPNEYERRNSHLVWIRGISQTKYHGSLCIANCVVSMAVLLMFYIMLGAFLIMNGHAEMMLREIPAFLVTGINVIFAATFTSVLSIKLPSFATGFIGITAVILGTFYPVLSLASNVLGGLGGKVIKAVLNVIPDLNAVQKQGYLLMMNENMNFHKIVLLLIATYIVTMGILFFKRKEA